MGNLSKVFWKQTNKKSWGDWVSLLNSRLSFYHRLQVVEKGLEKCLTFGLFLFKNYIENVL